jgi:nucleoside-diphosphate-sugar epimerase
VDGIFHTASPLDFSLKTYEQLVIPAVRGSETLLASALKAGSQLTSVVVTSSVVAIVNPKDEPEYIFSEADSASASLEKANADKEAGIETPVGILYGASKTAADRAVWKFRTEKKPSFAISTVNPSVVIGPPVVLASSGEKLNETLRPLWGILSGTSKTIPPNIGTGSFVDVRDVAFMHIWAYENPSKADGERYIACQGYGPLQAAADVLRNEYKGTTIGERITVGTPGDGYDGFNKTTGLVDYVRYPAGRSRVSGKKAEEAMGFKYITYPQSVLDSAKALLPLL